MFFFSVMISNYTMELVIKIRTATTLDSYIVISHLEVPVFANVIQLCSGMETWIQAHVNTKELSNSTVNRTITTGVIIQVLLGKV